MTETIRVVAPRRVLWQLLKVGLIYLPWGWLLTVLSAPVWVIGIVVVLIWSSTAVKRDGDEIFDSEQYGLFIGMVLLPLVLGVASMVNMTAKLREYSYQLGVEFSIPSATYTAVIVFILIPACIMSLAYRYSSKLWYPLLKRWFRKFWIIPILMMHFFIIHFATLAHNTHVSLPLTELPLTLGKFIFDSSFTDTFLGALAEAIALVYLLDIAIASAFAWINSVTWIMPVARRDALQIFTPFGAAAVLTLAGVLGLGSGWLVGQILYL